MDGNKLLDELITATFIRDCGKPEEQYLKDIGLGEDVTKSEKQVVREARFALVTECMKEFLKLNDKLNLLAGKIKLIENKRKEEENNG